MENKYSEILDEMLDLAGVPLTEADEDEDEVTADKAPEIPLMKADDDEEENPDDDKAEEELQDEWEKKVKTGSTFKIAIHENYVYVWYRDKRSPKIPIDAVLRKERKKISGLLNKIMSYVEKSS